MAGLGSDCILLFFGLLATSAWMISASGGPTFTINLHSGATIHINRSETTQLLCNVCIGTTCQPSVSIRSSTEVVFACPKPEDIFTVEIVRHIVCANTCNSTIIPEEYPSLQNFNRTFTWNVTVQVHKAFYLNFTRAGLRQIQPTETCQDKHVYTVSTGATRVGTFCHRGMIKGMQLLRQGSVSLMVPGKQQLESTKFEVSPGPEIKSLAIINVTLAEEESSQGFLSPNYPDGFPDDDLITWSFHVPAKFHTTVQILNYTEPECWKKDTRLEYQLNGKTMVRKLNEPQLSEHPGSFSLSLHNCEKEPDSKSSSLSLYFNISSIRRGREVRCTVDTGKERGLLIHIYKKKPKPTCILKFNSLVQEMITIPSARTSFVSFIDCTDEDLIITVNKTIACQGHKDCPHSRVSMGIPALEKCLVGVLQQVTWHMYGPHNSAIELESPVGLMQSLPGHICNSSVLLTVSENEPQGITVGQFCPHGDIQKMQIHTANITVNAMAAGGKNLRWLHYPLLNVSFIGPVEESYIFNILPKKDIPVFLATPAWPFGMRPHSTVSWFVSFPPQLEAYVRFSNVSLVTCKNWHTSIKVQMQHSEGKIYNWNNQSPKDLVVTEDFYLNMSNCMPVQGAFSVISQITLQTQKNSPLTIILSVVGVVLLLIGVITAVVCVNIRKKKKQMEPAVSVYNPDPHAILPGLNGIPSTTENEDNHIYHYIDDTLVYTHLLKDSVAMNGFSKPAVGVYQAFPVPTERQPLKEDLKADETQIGVYRPFMGLQSAPELPNRLSQQPKSLASETMQLADLDIGHADSVPDRT